MMKATATGASAIDTRDAIRRGDLTAEAATALAVAAIRRQDPSLHAFLHVDEDAALERARRLDRDAARAGRLHGVPIALKDNLAVRGMPATAGSRALEGYRPPYTATVVEALEREGAVIIGKTVCDEFAMGSSTEHCAWGPSRNPWALDRTPGGSSGGSAVAVAAGMTPVALGSDTGGSIRQPAALCGVVGLKPTYGRVSRYGLIAFASSLDQIGPFAATVADAALVLDVISGHDARDATSAALPPTQCVDELSPDVRGLRIGVPRHLLEEGLEADVATAFAATIARLEAAGAEIRTVTLPHSAYAIPVYYLVATAEASANLARYDGVRYGRRTDAAESLAAMYERTRRDGFGAEVKRRIMLGTYVLSAGYYDAYYLKAQQVRTLIRRDFERAFADVDVVATPTTPTGAFRLGERTEDPLQMYLADVFTVSAPLAGLPALSVPCGLTGERLPVGFQVIGPAWQESTLLRVAAAVQRDAA
jgi:aspartyl-tRNA(Asn)/glutamyl-tRNA(Gln) amidotransferase subunit A